MQYNARALTRACVQPYMNKLSIVEISRQEFKIQFEQKRYETLSLICAMRPAKINELCSEINRNSRSIFEIAVDPTIENLLLNLKEEQYRNLMSCDGFETNRLSM